MRPTPETNHALLQSLGAQFEVLRLAFYSLLPQVDVVELLRNFDAGATVLMANQQGKPLPEDYLVQLEDRLARIRAVIEVHAQPKGAPPR